MLILVILLFKKMDSSLEYYINGTCHNCWGLQLLRSTIAKVHNCWGPQLLRATIAEGDKSWGPQELSERIDDPGWGLLEPKYPNPSSCGLSSHSALAAFSSCEPPLTQLLWASALPALNFSFSSPGLSSCGLSSHSALAIVALSNCGLSYDSATVGLSNCGMFTQILWSC